MSKTGLTRRLTRSSTVAGIGGSRRWSETTASARNRLTGIVLAVRRDGVMAQVDLACGPNRVVSLMSREAADQLGLKPGDSATAVIKATTVAIERS